MDNLNVIEYLNREIENAIQRARNYHHDAPEREKWCKVADELLEAKHALERGIVASKKPARYT